VHALGVMTTHMPARSTHVAGVRVIMLYSSRTPTSTLFPYTTLFRSQSLRVGPEPVQPVMLAHLAREDVDDDVIVVHQDPHAGLRSEEHTSELQSRFERVCSLLLEKKRQSMGAGRVRHNLVGHLA